MSNLIERQAVKDLIKSGICTDTYDDMKYVCGLIDEFPSVTPTERTGHWIVNKYDSNFLQCSECECNWEKTLIENCNIKYCPNCGAKMVEPQESEE